MAIFYAICVDLHDMVATNLTNRVAQSDASFTAKDEETDPMRAAYSTACIPLKEPPIMHYTDFMDS